MTKLREQCLNLVGQLPEEQLPYYLAFLRDTSRIYNKELETALDDAYCLALYRDSLADDDEGSTPVEEVAAKWGIPGNCHGGQVRGGAGL